MRFSKGDMVEVPLLARGDFHIWTPARVIRVGVEKMTARLRDAPQVTVGSYRGDMFREPQGDPRLSVALMREELGIDPGRVITAEAFKLWCADQLVKHGIGRHALPSSRPEEDR